MNHCREAAHFFVCVYVILLGISSVYLSVGFPCNPWPDLSWTRVNSEPDSGKIVPSVKVGGCWRDCEAYAIRLHLALNPSLTTNNSPMAVVQHLLNPIQPNPFCFSPSLRPLLQIDGNPFCSRRDSDLDPYDDSPVISQKEFKFKVRESARVHAMVVGALCLDCIVISLAILLIYISTLQHSQPYAVTFPLTIISHLVSLFLSSYAARWLSCSPVDTKQRFCDGTTDVGNLNVTQRRNLPDKAPSVNNYEISLIIKNVNFACIVMAGLIEFSLRRTFTGGIGVVPLALPAMEEPHRHAPAGGGGLRLEDLTSSDTSSEDDSSADMNP